MAKKYRYEENILQTIFIGIFKIIWFLISLPFKGIKFGKPKSGLSIDEITYLTQKRLEVEKNLNASNDLELRHAVLEADKLVDYKLQALGFPGQTFADRLRSAEKTIPKNVYNDIWTGHKVRNQIAHETSLNISGSQLADAARKLLNYLK